MFDFGEDLTVPWLIWVQILVLFLLVLLLYCFSSFDFDISEDSSSAKTLFRRNSGDLSSCFFQVGGSRSIKGEVPRSSSRGILRIEEAIERGDSTFTDVSLTNMFHPCFYFRLARTAFLKCLGLDSASDCSSPTEHRKES